ncbi:odorant receptor 10-like isoform X2 [Linepithema humile]|uniref:odorant receptor 10-like isoform X2 n=1 Tax=Linepithema humile TaxID=83485 RepID=UPI00351F24A0
MRIDHPSNRLVENVLFTLFLDMASKRSNYKDFEWAIKLNRCSFKIIGLWPENHEVINTNNFVSNIQLLIMRWKRSAILLIVNMMAEDWMHLSTEAERYVMIKQVQFARLFTIYSYCIAALGVTTVTVLPSFGLHFRVITNLTDRDRVLPMQAYYFYDTDKSPQFELTLAAQFISMFFILIIYMSVDAFFMLTIFHICSQLKNFRYRLLNLVLYNDFNNGIRYIVETHLRLIRFADNIENIFSLSTLGVLLYFGVVFCIYGFLFITIIISNETSYISFSRICAAICGTVSSLVILLFYCIGGELVAKECEAVYRALCDLEWYILEPTESRALILIMIRTSKFFCITAGKIFPLSMATFCSVFKTSVGYISFLLAKRN